MADIFNISDYSINKNLTIKDAFIGLKTIQDFCSNQNQKDCDTGRCPLYKWCKTGGREEYPCNWSIRS